MSKKIHIDSATNNQLDYAAAVAQGFDIKINRNDIYIPVSIPNSSEKFTKYSPTTDQAQCGELIDKFEISTTKERCNWFAWTRKGISCYRSQSRLIAAVKAYLWSVYPDGMIEIETS